MTLHVLARNLLKRMAESALSWGGNVPLVANPDYHTFAIPTILSIEPMFVEY